MSGVPYVFDCPTRWGDMDTYGHLNNGSYVDYLQEARVDFLHAGDFAYMLGDDPTRPEEAVIVVGQQVEYISEATYDEPLKIKLVLDKVGAARFVVAYDVVTREDERLVVRARTTLCPFNLETNSIRRLSPVEKEWFTERQGEVGEFRKLEKSRPGAGAFVHPFRVRWSDLDSYRHANNVRAFDYLQEARITFRDHVRAQHPEIPASDDMWVVARQDVDYLEQINFRTTPYETRLGVAAVGRTSVNFTTEVVDPETGTVLVAGRSVLVHFQGRAATPVPDWARAAYEPFMV